MTSFQGTGKKPGLKPNPSPCGKRSLKAIHDTLGLMAKASSVTDPIRMFEEIFESNLPMLSKKSLVVEEILNITLDMLQGAKKRTLENYILTYLPYHQIDGKFCYSVDRVASTKKNQSVIISLTDFFDAFQKSPLSLPMINKTVVGSPKKKRDLLANFFPQTFDNMSYHHYGNDGERRKRRKALLAMMEATVASNDSWLKGPPKSPERAIALAKVFIERIKIAKKQHLNFKDAMDAWREDIVYLKYNYFDSVLHLNGLKWPNVGS
ncbi:TPA: hypothetical protein QDZ12_000253 [Pseudomonas putida]|nr:hypothetical protein [Pseudomonas putida]